VGAEQSFFFVALTDLANVLLKGSVVRRGGGDGELSKGRLKFLRFRNFKVDLHGGELLGWPCTFALALNASQATRGW
jgi:hypothetical protein